MCCIKEKWFKSGLCTIVRLIDHNRNVRFIDRDTFTSSTECSAEPARSLSFIFGLQLAKEFLYSAQFLHFRRNPYW